MPTIFQAANDYQSQDLRERYEGIRKTKMYRNHIEHGLSVNFSELVTFLRENTSLQQLTVQTHFQTVGGTPAEDLPLPTLTLLALLFTFIVCVGAILALGAS